LFSFACAGELPLEVIRMKANGVKIQVHAIAPGFTLPTNIGELGDDITTLDLSNCSLTGTIVCPKKMKMKDTCVVRLLTFSFFWQENCPSSANWST